MMGDPCLSNRSLLQNRPQRLDRLTLRLRGAWSCRVVWGTLDESDEGDKDHNNISTGLRNTVQSVTQRTR